MNWRKRGLPNHMEDMRRRMHGWRRFVIVSVGLWAVSAPAAFFWARLRCPSVENFASSLRGASNVERRGSGGGDWNEAAPFDASKLAHLDHLVVVCGHAVLTTTAGLEGVEKRDDLWYLLPYQRGHDLAEAFVSHIERGVALAAADERALLVFSGGETRAAAGPRSEGLSYWLVAEHKEWWGRAGPQRSKEEQLDVRQRTVVESYARDSLENLLFSIARFRQVTGRYPKRFTVVGFDFKAERFTQLHRAALGIAPAAFAYEGLRPRPSSRFQYQEAAAGEAAHARQPFVGDPYGCRNPALVEKKKERDPFRRAGRLNNGGFRGGGTGVGDKKGGVAGGPGPGELYALAAPEIRGLLTWCGPGKYTDALPWSR